MNNEESKINKCAVKKFKDFRNILTLLHPHITELETVELYKESWNIGAGMITPSILFVVLSENNFFIKQMKLFKALNNADVEL